MLKHEHLIIRAEVEKPLKDPIIVEQWINELIEKISMKKLAGPLVVYLDKEGNRGITSVAIIETSHIAMHVWDEDDPAIVQLDVYSCAKLPIKNVIEHMQIMNPVKVECHFIDRENGIRVCEI